MAGKTSTFLDFNPPACDAAWLNMVTTEFKNIIESSGQTLSDVTLDQIAISMASYAAQGSFFTTDSGVADSYILTQISPFKAPFALRNGMSFKFRAGNTNAGASTVVACGFASKAILQANGAPVTAGMIPNNQDTEIRYDGTNFRLTGVSALRQQIIQVVNFETGTYAAGTTILPVDNTIPQNTEGTEFMTLAITPTNAANKLRIDVVFNGTLQNQGITAIALFQDSTANALAAVKGSSTNTIECGAPYAFTHYMDAGTISATTFKVRAGGAGANTLYFNGASGAQLFGGVYASSITITEIKP